MGAHSGEFHADDLVKVDASKMVVLISGGPLMDVLSISDRPEGKYALCQWHDGDGLRTKAYHIEILGRIIRLDQEFVALLEKPSP